MCSLHRYSKKKIHSRCLYVDCVRGPIFKPLSCSFEQDRAIVGSKHLTSVYFLFACSCAAIIDRFACVTVEHNTQVPKYVTKWNNVQ